MSPSFRRDAHLAQIEELVPVPLLYSAQRETDRFALFLRDEAIKPRRAVKLLKSFYSRFKLPAIIPR
jgi:hypothetical protein